MAKIDKFEFNRRQLALFGWAILITVPGAVLISIFVSAFPSLARAICHSELSAVAWPSNEFVKHAMIEAGGDASGACKLIAARSLISLMLLIYFGWSIRYAMIVEDFNFSYDFIWVYGILIPVLPIFFGYKVSRAYSKYDVQVDGDFISNIRKSFVEIFIVYITVSGFSQRLIIFFRSKIEN